MMPACPVCGGVEVDVQGAYRGSHALFANLQRAHCRSCGMAFAHPMPSASTLAAYNAAYFSTAHGGKPTARHATAFFSGIARLRQAYLERYLDAAGIRVGSVLELGPGPGFFVRSWLERHPGTAYFGVETDVSCHGILSGLGVRVLDMEALADGAQPVDLVVMSHVLEHVPDPVEFITACTRNLHPGGAIFIEVPCRDYEHKALDEPHVLFFDKAPMKQLLERVGFDAVEVSYYGVPIERLRASRPLHSVLAKVRARLVALGLVGPFGRQRAGMAALDDPLERAVVAPFLAHAESAAPAWWLRALARKR